MFAFDGAWDIFDYDNGIGFLFILDIIIIFHQEFIKVFFGQVCSRCNKNFVF